MSARVLVAGGTGFLGGAIVDAAQAAGHDVSVLSRGRKAGGKPGVRHVAADRYGPLDALRGERFDFIFDTCAFTPNSVGRLLEAAGAAVQRYALISSASVYGDWSKNGLHEDDPVPGATAADLRHADAMERSATADAANAGDSYGPLKRSCEEAAERMLGDRAVSLRSGLLIGAGDYTDRMTWWVRRFDQGGRVPVPLPEERPIQAIDVRDAAAFALSVADDGRSGIINLTSVPFAFREFVDELCRLPGVDADPVWIEEARFVAAGVEPWEELPLWLPQTKRFMHFFGISVARASAAGLRVRPLRDTLAGILEWDRTRRGTALSCGMTPEHERLLLRKHHVSA